MLKGDYLFSISNFHLQVFSELLILEEVFPSGLRISLRTRQSWALGSGVQTEAYRAIII
jgi:hypothetical protein